MWFVASRVLANSEEAVRTPVSSPSETRSNVCNDVRNAAT